MQNSGCGEQKIKELCEYQFLCDYTTFRIYKGESGSNTNNMRMNFRKGRGLGKTHKNLPKKLI